MAVEVFISLLLSDCCSVPSCVDGMLLVHGALGDLLFVVTSH